MMKLFYAVAALVLSSMSVDAWDCSDACSFVQDTSDEMSTMYTVLTDKTEYEPGTNIKVTLSSQKNTFSGVIVQAKRMGDLSTTGKITTLPDSNNVQLKDCNGDTVNDTACFAADSMSTASVFWHPPEPAGTARNVELQAVFFDSDGQIHRQHSVLLSENVKNTDKEDETVNLHDDTIEGEMEIIIKEKREKDIQMEDLATEDDQMKEEQRLKKEHDNEIRWEETQYEIENKKEEDERRARIQAEIADKEEYDRLMAEKEEKEREERERERERLERERERLERERERKEKEERERERENETKFDNGNGDEVDVNEKSNENGQTAGSSKMAAVSVGSVVAALLVLFV